MNLQEYQGDNYANLKTQGLESLEKKMLKLPQEPCPVTHKFGPGVYLREVFLPKNTLVIGHHHNFEHMNLFLKGKMTVIVNGETKELTAPMTITSQPGRKVAYTHEDCVWINIYATNETNVDKLESTLLTKSEGFLLDQKERGDLLRLTGEASKNDFDLINDNISKELEKIFSNQNFEELPYGEYKFKEGPSSIHGVGLFASGDILCGDIISPIILNSKRIMVGPNHSISSNAEIVQLGDDIFLVATKNIIGCLGGQDGEEITINYRDQISQLGEK